MPPGRSTGEGPYLRGCLLHRPGLGNCADTDGLRQTGISREHGHLRAVQHLCAPDSGTTSGSRQTLFTGEAVRRACQDLKSTGGKTLGDLEGQEFYGEYLGKTDPLGADVPNPVSHIAYGYATQLCVLDKDTGLKQIVAAHDVGKAVNPFSVEGQIEGGVVMSMGYALTERYPINENCRPTVKYGTLGLFRANQIPEIKPIIVEKPGLNVACGAIGIGEITSIPTAPAIADAYYRYDGKFRTSLASGGHAIQPQIKRFRSRRGLSESVTPGCHMDGVSGLLPDLGPDVLAHPQDVAGVPIRTRLPA